MNKKVWILALTGIMAWSMAFSAGAADMARLIPGLRRNRRHGPAGAGFRQVLCRFPRLRRRRVRCSPAGSWWPCSMSRRAALW